MTPEGEVKKKITALLNSLQLPNSGVSCYYRMPVPTGYGKSGLDYEGCINGLFFAIEAKAPGEWLTTRQRDTALAILDGGGKVFVISGGDGLRAFAMWVCQCLTNSARWGSTYTPTLPTPTTTTRAAGRTTPSGTPSSS